MEIDKSKFKLTLPDGVTQEGDIVVDNSQSTATIKVKAATEGTKNIKITYDGGSEKTVEVTVTKKST